MGCTGGKTDNAITPMDDSTYRAMKHQRGINKAGILDIKARIKELD